ncbi:hypothetical protein BU24DRAFT_207684 [Aaosphaeria arxii CBS 175.79]|uniref:C2H2-type domain-containing protein n=1 Tax=Aaosphaeria arxii CBS 175.79 TaxID=1450172 RepID=A0A6A5XTP2_9PLEO|nr:uncharacterized protein BU24DRAFT_207684 [Aaosphaeria arxii CBS 175.79]KAF2016678.1 hypothetical protein BU24DRAFT_207684 [Aaosphaeria arxii CBS 175.79]
MEPTVWNEIHYQPNTTLPKLRITRNGEVSRRDSIGSSRTGDSGYNSDPDLSLSPSDFLSADASAVSFPFANDLRTVFECPADDIIYSQHTQKFDSLKRPLVLGNNPCSNIHTGCPEQPDWIHAVKTPVNQPADTARSTCLSLHHLESRHQEEVEQWMDESYPSKDRPNDRVSSIVSLSSNGSGGDYSITDDSEDESPNMAPGNMSKATLATIDIIMHKVEVNLRYAAYVQCAGGNSGRRKSTTASSRRGSGQGMNTGQSKRRGRGDESLHPDGEDEDGPTKRRRVSVTTTEDSENGPKFACPFYKHDPNQYNKRTCKGPGWPTVHRVKEHLYRNHAQSIYCPRCYEVFDSDGDLSTHLRSQPCEMSEHQPMEGIDRNKLETLRKRSIPGRLEEDKWRDTYQLLFPEVAEADIPSPYYDCDSPSEESRRFRRELLQRIRQEIHATAEREDGPVEQKILGRVAGIIRQCEDELRQSFYSGPASSHITPMLHVPHNNTPPPDPQPPHAPTEQPRAPPTFTGAEWGDPFHMIPSDDIIDWNMEFPPDLLNDAPPILNDPVWAA